MQSRKLVKSGNTSFTITLPIDWVRRNDLDAGSTVNVEETSSGDIVLSAERSHAPVRTSREPESISVEERTSEQIELEITIQYIRDSPAVVLTGHHSAHKSEHIADVVGDLIGFEIIEQDTDAITIKNFFRLDEETSPLSISQKMFHINRAFFLLIEGFFENGLSKQDVYEAEQLMQQNYKLSYVAEKGILMGIQDPETVKRLRTNPLDLLKRKRYVQGSRNVSAYLHSAAELFNLIEVDASGVEELGERFSSLKDRHDALASDIRNSDVEHLRELLIASWAFEKEIEELVSRFEDGLLVQATTLLFAVNQELGDMAYESLL